LQALEADQENTFPRVPGKQEFATEAAPAKTDVSIFDLINAVNAVLQRLGERDSKSREIFEDKWTVSEKIEFIHKIIAERGAVKFSELFADAANRTEVICTFLALLELIRLKQIVCAQSETFGEIEITRATPALVPAAANPPAAPAAEAAAEPWRLEPPDTQTA
jgi:segregation and condensation protein A